MIRTVFILALIFNFIPRICLGAAPASRPAFTLTSPAVKDNGDLPVQFTGDGEGATPPLEWNNPPEGTQGYALIMHHVAPDQTKCYWIIYNIPPQTARLEKNVKNVGVLGVNSTNGKAEYLPPHSKGPGAKTYILTLYALSGKLDLGPLGVGREQILEAMKGRILGEATLHVVYTRNGDDLATLPPPPPPPRPTETIGGGHD